MKEKVYLQSGVVPCRIVDNRVFILLVESTRSGWVIPKGGIASNLTPLQSALKEAWEEAGVKGIAKKKRIGIYTYSKYGVEYSVKVFLMYVNRVYSRYPEQRTRKRKWVALDSINDYVKDETLLNIITDTLG